MSYNNYSITIDTHNINGKIVGAYATETYLCSSALAFTPTSGVSSFRITNIDIIGASSGQFLVSADKALPFTVVNGTTNSILFNVSFANTSPSETTLVYAASAKVSTSGGALSAESTGTFMTTLTTISGFSVNGTNGWRGSDGGRIWTTHAEHARMRNLGFI